MKRSYKYFLSLLFIMTAIPFLCIAISVFKDTTWTNSWVDMDKSNRLVLSENNSLYKGQYSGQMIINGERVSPYQTVEKKHVYSTKTSKEDRFRYDHGLYIFTISRVLFCSQSLVDSRMSCL